MCFLQDLRGELQCRLGRQASLHALWSQLQAGEEAEEGGEAQEKLHVTGSKLKLLLRQVDQDLGELEQRLVSDEGGAAAAVSVKMDGACRSSLEELHSIVWPAGTGKNGCKKTKIYEMCTLLVKRNDSNVSNKANVFFFVVLSNFI